MLSLILFEVGSQNLAIKAEFITEIIRAVTVTPLPELPLPYSGIINYRGRVVPVVRLGDLPGFKSYGSALTEYMIIIDSGSPTGICLVVDQVKAFKTVEALQPLTDLESLGYQSRLTPEIVKLETGLVPVLEVAALLPLTSTALTDRVA